MSRQVFSGSSVTTFLRCGQQWEFAYVYEYKRPPNLRAVIGLAAHEAVELNYRQKLLTREDLQPEEVVDGFVDSFARLAADVEADGDETVGQAEASGIALVRHYQKDVAPSIQPLWVEEEVQFTVDDIPYSGWLDLVDDDQNIRDLKTTKRTPSDLGARYAISMTGYALGYRAKTGTTENDVVLDYMIRTKTPKYLKVTNGGPVPDEQIAKFGHILRSVEEGVSAGRFTPNGLYNGACNWCGYTDICPAYSHR